MIKVTKSKYLMSCDACNNECTYLIRADREYNARVYRTYIHLCTSCLLKLKGELDESQKQVEQ